MRSSPCRYSMQQVVRRLTLCALFTVLCAPLARAADEEDDPFANSTAHGVTVTKDQILDALESCSAFWPRVCRHLETDGADMGSPTVRREAATAIRQIQGQLHSRMFGDDEAAALDVIAYIKAELRRAALFRDLATVVDNRPALIEMRRGWRELAERATSDDPRDLEAQFRAHGERVLAEVGLPAERHAAAVELVHRSSASIPDSLGTQAWRLMVAQFAELENAQVQLLVRSLVDAADWANVCRDASGPPVSLDELLAAWRELRPQHAATGEFARN